MRLNQFAIALGCLSVAAVGVADTNDRHFPAPSTLSPEMTEAVNAPTPDLWLSKVQTAAEVHALAADYAKNDGQAYRQTAHDLGVKVEEIQMAGVSAFVLTPKNLKKAHKDKVIFYIHGGGYILGHGVSCIGEAIPMAAQNGYKVICVDYRMAPEYPFPAAIDDAFAVYREVVKNYGAKNVAVFGSSTGGAMTLVLALQAHAAGFEMPAALIAGSPWSDMDKIGDSYQVNEGVDNILGTYDRLIKTAARLYANGHNLKDPFISPVYASDSALKAFPPTLLLSGTRDLFLSNTARMHTRLLLNKVQSELIVYEALSHVQYYLNPKAPETQQHYRLLADFLDRIWQK